MWPFFCRFEVDEVWRAIVTRKKTLRKLSAALLSAAMCFGFLIPVFAEGEGDNPSFAQTENMPVSNTEPSAGNTEISEPQSDASAAQGNPDPTSDQSTESPDAAADDSVQDAEESSDSSSSSDESTSSTDSKPSDSYSEADGEIGKEENESSEDANEKDGSSEEETPAKTVQFEKTADLIHVTAKTTSDILPEDAEMRVKLYSDQDEEFRAAENALNSSQVNFDGLLVVDVSFWKDGKEIEPEDGTVDVQMSFNKTLVDDEKTENSLQVHHISEKDGTKVEQVACESKQTIQDANETYKAEFKVDSFSSFTITWNRNGNTYFTLNVNLVDELGNAIHSSVKPDIVIVGQDSKEKTTINLRTYGINYCPSGYEYLNATLTNEGETSTIDNILLERKEKQVTATFKQGSLAVTTARVNSATVNLVYREKAPDQYLLNFHKNDGPDLGLSRIEGQQGEIVTLPDVTVVRTGYKFLGWSTSNDLRNGNGDPLYPANTPYQLTQKNQTLYAIWQNENVNRSAEFYIRLDGEIPFEPSDYTADKYTDMIKIEGAIQEERWIIDSSHNGYWETSNPKVNALNDVSRKLSKVPSAQQIKKALATKEYDFDPETEYVLWYVQKLQNLGETSDGGQKGRWHVDGVVLKKQLVNVTYNRNCDDNRVTVPSGHQEVPGTQITVGYDKDGKEVVPKRDGYVFLGWTKTPDGTGQTIYNSLDPYILNENTTFYAQWALDLKQLIVRKSVVGNFADRTQKFKFHVQVLDSDNEPYLSANSAIEPDNAGWYTFDLSNGDQCIFNVPQGGHYQVWEDPLGYIASYKITTQTKTESGSTNDTGSKEFNGETVVIFQNEKQGTVPGGLHDDSEENSVLVTGSALGILALAAYSLIFRKEREHEQR